MIISLKHFAIILILSNANIKYKWMAILYTLEYNIFDREMEPFSTNTFIKVKLASFR